MLLARPERIVNLAGRVGLHEFIALLGRARVLVTNDSGPLHLAAAAGTSTVSLFGPETPAVFGARTARTHILWAGIACSPCVNAFNDRQSACRDNLCLQGITVDQVFELACRVLEGRRSAA